MAEIKQKYGGLKIAWHPDKLKALLEEEVTAPIYVRIKPTNKCNHRCFYCSYDPDFKYALSEGLRREDEIPQEKMIEILNDFKEIGVKAITFSGGGEPLLYPYIEEAMEKALENCIALSIITNGQLLNGKKAELLAQAKWMRVSLDSINKETFAKIRRVSEKLFEPLIENLKNFAKIKNKDCEFGINFVVNEHNADQVYDSVKFFKEIGVNHIKITPLYTPREFKKYHEPFKEKVLEQIKKARQDFVSDDFAIYDTYENDFKLTSIHNRTYSKCFIMQTVPVIGADSSVYFCHDKTYQKSGALGSIKNRSFKDLWFSKEAKEKFKNFNPQKYCQQHCTYDARNILIKDIINAYNKDHINFP